MKDGQKPELPPDPTPESAGCEALKIWDDVERMDIDAARAAFNQMPERSKKKAAAAIERRNKATEERIRRLMDGR